MRVSFLQRYTLLLVLFLADGLQVNSFQTWQRPPKILSTTTQLYSSSSSSSSSSLHWQSHASTHPDSFSALRKVLSECTDDSPDIAFLFVGQFHAEHFSDLLRMAASSFPPTCQLVSVVGGGVVGENMEFDEAFKPSISLLTGRVPDDAEVEFFWFNELEKKNPPPEPNSPYWKKLHGTGPSSYFLIADPWSPIETILEILSSQKDAVVAGGISVPEEAGSTIGMGALALPQGSVLGIRFGGSVALQTVVAQGCRPVGPAYTISECEQNIITKLNGDKTAVQALEEVIASASSVEERQQIQSGLVVGLSSATEDGDDYLIRQLAGFVPQKGGVIVGGTFDVGDRFRWHIRDKDAAQEDLKLMVQRAKTERQFYQSTARPLAALQVSCVARGRYMFGVPNVDLSYVKDLTAGAPVGGFFANGEFGPIGLAGFSSSNSKETFMHGFTTVISILCETKSSNGSSKESYDDENASFEMGADDAWG